MAAPDRETVWALTECTLVRFRHHAGQLSGPATKWILWRACHICGDERHLHPAEISNGCIYDLRARRAYRQVRTTVRVTQAASSEIGRRRKPRPAGRAGVMRVDTVHDGGRNGEKGSHVIDMVD